MAQAVEGAGGGASLCPPLIKFQSWKAHDSYELMAGQGPARRRRASRLHPVRLVALTLFCLLLSGFAGAAAYFFPVVVAGVGQTGQTVVVPPSRSPGVSATPPPSAAAGAPFTVLLLGSDDDSKFQADHVLTQSMILVRVEPATKHVTMLSIPRDLWVPLSTGGSAKIDAAYSYGGAAAAMATVERNFHVHVDEYAWIGLKGLIKLIDQLVSEPQSLAVVELALVEDDVARRDDFALVRDPDPVDVG